MKRVCLAITGMGLFAIGGCVAAEALSDVGAVLNVLDLIVGGLEALI